MVALVAVNPNPEASGEEPSRMTAAPFTTLVRQSADAGEFSGAT
jgi:hypothetical protein